MTSIKPVLLLSAIIFAMPMLTLNPANAEKDKFAIDVPTASTLKPHEVAPTCTMLCMKQKRQWNGSFTPTTCSCNPMKRDIAAGYIADNDYAKDKCPGVCEKNDMVWTKQWHSTSTGNLAVGKDAVCECRTK